MTRARALWPVGALVTLGLLMLLPHLLHGGFYSDDWGNASDYTFAAPPRYPTAVSEFSGLLGGRPLLAVLLPLPYAVFGVDQTPHLVLAAVLAVLVVLSFYAVLRALGLPALDAALIAALALAFPWSDAAQLWPTAAINNAAVIFFLLGLRLALAGLERRGQAAIALHAAAVALFVMSVLTYEVAAAAALLAGALYLGRAPRRKALVLWAVDAAAVLGALAYEWHATSTTRGVAPLSSRWDQLPRFVRESSWLVARTVYPDAGSKVVRDVVLAAVVVAVAAALARGRRDAEVRSWLVVVAAAAIAIVAADLMVEGSGLFPLSPGLDNRGNIFAALGYAAFTYGVLRLAAMAVLYPRNGAAVVVSTLAALAVLGWYVAIVRDDVGVWDHAATRQAELLRRLDRTLPRPPQGTTIFLYGSPREVAAGVPVFDADWDLNGAVKLLYDDGSLRAFPAPENGLRCGPSGVPRPLGVHFDQPDEAPYGKVLAFNAATSATRVLKSASDCRRVNALFGANAIS
jgi:hypothetical protein